MSPCYNAPSHFYLYLVIFVAIDKLMPCSSIVNKATGQVCRPAEKNGWEKKLSNINKNGIDYCKLNTCTYNSFTAIWGLTAMYLHFIHSNMGTNCDRYNFSSRVKTCSRPGRAPFFIFSRTQVRITVVLH